MADRLRGALLLGIMSLGACAQNPPEAPPSMVPVALAAPGMAKGLAEEDLAAAKRAEQAALDEDRVVHWSGSGVLGRIIPRHEWVADGKVCRAYTHVIASESAIKEWRRAACHGDDGAWETARAASLSRQEPTPPATR